MAHRPPAPGCTVLRDVVAPAEVVVGPGGVIVALAADAGGRADLRVHVRRVRAALDAAGLRALPVDGLRSRTPIDVAGVTADDERFGPATLRRAVTALSPAPPWVATVTTPAGPARRRAQPDRGWVRP